MLEINQNQFWIAFPWHARFRQNIFKDLINQTELLPHQFPWRKLISTFSQRRLSLRLWALRWWFQDFFWEYTHLHQTALKNEKDLFGKFSSFAWIQKTSSANCADSLQSGTSWVNREDFQQIFSANSAHLLSRVRTQKSLFLQTMAFFLAKQEKKSEINRGNNSESSCKTKSFWSFSTNDVHFFS